jgi:hypothetical protein
MMAKMILLASRILREHSKSLSNRSCNDWDFPEDFTTADKAEFVREACRLEVTDDPDRDYLMDWQVAETLSLMLEEMSK